MDAVAELKMLKKEYPDAKYYLNFSSPLELVVAAILSAQCRDEVVNATTKVLFKKCRT
ncbi:MAG: endonuclease III, partial [Candidatus Aenigmarchaeota archaeon]|nr:endonuclease III [Candidatus Aenigmarchaeota archaeon]